MKTLLAGLVAATALVAGPALAQKPDDLLKANACTSCHAIDKKMVGPSYKDVAAKYAGQKDAEANLAAKVKKGGSGVWGQVPMPPNAHVKDADIAAMVKYILTVK